MFDMIKAAILRLLAAGNMGERDVYGIQRRAPLVNFKFEV